MKQVTYKIIIGIVFFVIILNLPTCLIAVYNESPSVGRYNDFRSNLQPSTLVREDASDFSKMPLENLTISQENNLILDKQLTKNTIFNFVISPQTAKYFYYNFNYLYNLGIKRFNLLPAYYNEWNAAQLRILDYNFQQIFQHSLSALIYSL